MRRRRPPPAARPRSGSGRIDPIARELIKSALSCIADDMANTVLRTAYSTVIRDCMDYSTALCDPDGQMVAQGVTIPAQLGSIPFALGAVLKKFQGDIRPGDTFIMNDPYEGGIHLPDIFLFKAIHAGRELIGFGATVAHHLDVGGRVPGSCACDSTEVYQEGLRIPPLKLYDRGAPNRTIFEMIEKNVRVPTMVLGDLRAKLAGCTTAEQGLQRLAREHGPARLRRYLDDLLDHTERLARAQIAAWPDGTYRFTDHLDNDGVEDRPIPIDVTLTVKGDGLLVDFAGTSPQVKGAINSPISFTTSVVAYALHMAMGPEIPNTSGLFRPFTVVAPEGTIVNPVLPAACGMRGVTGFRVADALFGALAQVVPDRIWAAGEGGISLVIMGGYGERREPFVLFDLIAGTWGGRPTKDGNDGVANPCGVISNIPAELAELSYPVRIERYGLVPDSGGAGKSRGGLAIIREWRFLGEEATLSIRSDRRKFPPYGLQGGLPGAPSWNILNPDGEARVLETKPTLGLKHGDVVRHVTAGGGGFGDPRRREPGRVWLDVLNEKVSVAKARELYGVAIDPATGALDRAATERLREELRRSDAPIRKSG
jgi:N-methylhydantoinase B